MDRRRRGTRRSPVRAGRDVVGPRRRPSSPCRFQRGAGSGVNRGLARGPETSRASIVTPGIGSVSRRRSIAVGDATTRSKRRTAMAEGDPSTGAILRGLVCPSTSARTAPCRHATGRRFNEDVGRIGSWHWWTSSRCSAALSACASRSNPSDPERFESSVCTYAEPAWATRDRCPPDRRSLRGRRALARSRAQGRGDVGAWMRLAASSVPSHRRAAFPQVRPNVHAAIIAGWRGSPCSSARAHVELQQQLVAQVPRSPADRPYGRRFVAVSELDGRNMVEIERVPPTGRRGAQRVARAGGRWLAPCGPILGIAPDATG